MTKSTCWRRTRTKDKEVEDKEVEEKELMDILVTKSSVMAQSLTITIKSIQY